ncbi:MAG: dienelactone hydrolase family protein [Chloroflexota bacterium]|nr:MAG: carboxymethylenebutenolidase [Chloroflexota bacterium]
MLSEFVTYATNGEALRGYLSRPEADGQYMGVIVIQEWWGVNAHIQDVTRRVAGIPAVALAPDLYHGAIAIEPDEARKKAMELDRARAIEEIRAAVEYLAGLEMVAPKKIGIIGFCMGGGLALHSAARIPEVGAVVAFYGGSAPAAEDFTNREVAILNIVGEKDTGVLEKQRKLDTDLRNTPIQHELVVYPGVGHAFFNDTRQEAYSVSAAQDAWARTVDWLRSHLRA